MGKFDTYKIDLKGLVNDKGFFSYDLDNSFFTLIDAPEVQKGKLHVDLTVKKTAGVFVLDFQTKGVVQIPCDRCLDDMDLEIASTDTVKVKFGTEYTEEGDIVVVPEEEGAINVAWFVYEFIALAIPMKHVHAPGKCNRMMTSKLSKHIRVDANEEEGWGADEEGSFAGMDDEEASGKTDPRWNDLKKILDNN